MDKILTYGVPSILGFFLSFGGLNMDNPLERSVYAVIAASVSGVLIRLISTLPKLWEARAAAKKTREDILAAANDKLITSLQASLDVARLRADTAEEARELEKASKHLLQTYYGNACNHLQYRAQLLQQAGIAFDDFPFTEILTLMRPYDDRIRDLMAAKTAVTRDVVSKATTQAITLGDKS